MGRKKGVLEIQIDNDIIDLRLNRILDFNDAIYSHRPQKKVLDYDKECARIIYPDMV